MAIAYRAELAQQVQDLTGENPSLCWQCQKCTDGCPVADHFDLEPHALLRAVQLGQKEQVLRSRTIWLCAACETCSTRCPQGIHLPRLMDALKMMALREGVEPAVASVPAFYSAALRGIKLFGRMYEAGLMAELYLRLALHGELDREQFMQRDLPLGLRMLRTGKLSPLPPLSRSARHAPRDQHLTTSVTAAYYPGCSLHGTAREYDLSVRAVAGKIGLRLVEPDGWVCCGTTPAHSTDHLLATTMPIRTLALVERAGHSCVTVPCPSCFVRFRTAMQDVASDPELGEQVRAQVGPLPSTELTVEHLLTTIAERVGEETVAEAVTLPLKGLKVVCYYGCAILRPPELTGASDCEYPMAMDRLVQATGATSLDWSGKTDCCGASLAFTQLPIALEMSRKVLAAAGEVGAEAVVVACPLCHANLDLRQAQIAEEAGESLNLPVLYFTQLLGLAFGLEPTSLGLDSHFVDPGPLLREKGIR